MKKTEVVSNSESYDDYLKSNRKIKVILFKEMLTPTRIFDVVSLELGHGTCDFTHNKWDASASTFICSNRPYTELSGRNC